MAATGHGDSWQRRIDRATELSAQDATVRPLLDTYRRLLILQRDYHASLCARVQSLTGALESDLDALRSGTPRVLDQVAAFAPAALADHARFLLDGGDAAVDSMLLDGWRTPSDRNFLARLLLQPYAQCLAAHDIRPLDRDLPRRHNTCPFCGGAPQVSVLHHADDTAGGRDLVCGTCFTTWSFRRVLCAGCGEDDERRLAYFQAQPYEHVRIDGCETCKRYLKSVDLGRVGFAIPIVDEVAAAPLDLWAREHGYQKLELNLVGL